MVPRIAYMLKFSDEEKAKINRLYQLDSHKKLISVLFGVLVAALIFFSQAIYYGEPHFYHFVATYFCIPVGISCGVAAFNRLDHHIEMEFLGKWDKLYMERAGHTEESLDRWLAELEATEQR